MKDRTLIIAFAIATALFWGCYGPVLGKARSTARPPEWTPFKPYLFIGLAYLVWGCVAGAGIMKSLGDNFSFSGIYAPAAKWGFIAGSLGAFGALTLTFAMFKAKGDGSLVMPIVFGGATMISVLTTAYLTNNWHFKPPQYIGFLLVALGVILIQAFAAHGPAPAAGHSTPPAQSSGAAPPH